ncbi:RIP metalloprotease RseP [Clostridium cylindrosporum]|uniref:Zinc metalloprotease n=1 Tax=Clostridium cylindrosporum DSM 605 TaxID=1121307 RepID=A0A0J8DAL6_CLOCY|nr:RIP metalloprotease RseP [Clostridium cylindrosporum]KMT23075.1 putative zinc metalloprotease [Clostridium cylindrosporum DSM 605]
MTTFLAAILVFGLLIATHEFGHFITAKLSKVKVLEFAIGMGPKIFSFTKGETDYTLRLLPIGGYVKMLGEEDGSDDPRAFCNQNPWKRLLIIVAGAAFNIITAIVIFTLVFYNQGSIKPIVSSVDKNYPAYEAGILPNDKIIQINNEKIRTWNEVIMFISENKEKPFNVKVERNNTIKEIKLSPKYNEKEKRYMIGMAPTLVKGNILEAFKDGFTETFSSIKQMVSFIGTLVTGGASMDSFGGPVAIVDLSGKAAQAGIWTFLSFVAFLSINLGVLNLIPFPALDGGWVIILLIEALTGKKIDQNKIGVLNFIGFALLMAFIVFVTYNDILRFFK